jgi:hypothetical protein
MPSAIRHAMGVCAMSETWIITIRPEDRDSNDAGRRIAYWLKIGLRQFGLRCVGYRLANAAERFDAGMADDTPDAQERASAASMATGEPTEIF